MLLGPDALYGFPRNLVLAASAGTGKTHALVGVIVELLVGNRTTSRGKREPIDPSRIVATTFSRKAAAEIRARVTHELERLAAEPATSVYAAGLQARHGLKDDVVRRRAAHALSRLPWARFGTLHSFATGLVRSYAVEIGLGPGFEIASETEARMRAEEAIARALESELASSMDILRSLSDAAGGVDRLVTTLRRVLTQMEEDGRRAADLEIAAGDAAAVGLLLEHFVDHARDLIGVPKFDAEAREVVAARAADRGADTATSSRLEGAISALAAVPATGKKVPAVEAFAVFRRDLPGATNEEKGRRLARTFTFRERFQEQAAVVRRVLAAAATDIETVGRERSSLGFGEILRTARDLLIRRPDIADDVSADLEALLVDEFQDTSRVQRELIQLVWAKRGKRERDVVPPLTAVRENGLLVVGDRKQSIYGFRGADVSVFAELAVGLAGAPAREALGIPPGMAWEPKTPSADFCALRHNRRSIAPILTFANAFSARRFDPLRPPELFEIDYVPETEDLLVPPNATTAQEDAPPYPATTWLRVVPKGGSSSRIEEALVIAERIRDLVPGTAAAPVAWRDIAVLATTNGMLDATAFALAQAEIPYVVAGKSFYRAREIRDLAALLALVLDPTDRQAAVAVLRGPWGGLHDETLLALVEPGRGLVPPDRWTSPPDPSLVKAGDEVSLRNLSRLVLQLARVAARIGPSAILREAVRALELEAVLAGLPRGRQRIANVRKLLALAERHQEPHLFLRWLNEASELEVGETEAATFSADDDAVRLLTVHASKGLDFPIVFVPEVASPPPRSERGVVRVTAGVGTAPSSLSLRIVEPNGLVLDPPSFTAAYALAKRRERAERQRLAYVAITRAARMMFMVGGRAKEGSGDAGATSIAVLEELARDASAHALVVEDAVVPSPLVGRAESAVPTAVADGPAVAPVALPLPTWRSLPIAPTALADFAHCARRFELIHLLGLPERPRGRIGALERSISVASTLDARARGTIAHAVLERIPLDAFGNTAAIDVTDTVSRALVGEGVAADDPAHSGIVDRVAQFLTGEYAQKVANDRASVRREVPFVLAVEDGKDHEVVLRGSIDLLVAWPDGTVDVVDYKSARGGAADAYAFQLDIYVLAARAMYPDARVVRAGLVFLGGKNVEPVWRATSEETIAKERLASLGNALVGARWTDTFPRVELPRCEAIYCGFIGRCHSGAPSGGNGTVVNASRETTT